MQRDPQNTAPTPEADALDGHLCFAIYSAGLAFNRAYKPLLDRLGLTYPQYLVIALLRARDGRTVGELGERLFLDSSTLTPLLKRMEAAGLVARRRAAEDERVVRITLTDKGRDIAREAAGIADAVTRATGRAPEQLTVLEKAITRLRDTLRESV